MLTVLLVQASPANLDFIGLGYYPTFRVIPKEFTHETVMVVPTLVTESLPPIVKEFGPYLVTHFTALYGSPGARRRSRPPLQALGIEELLLLSASELIDYCVEIHKDISKAGPSTLSPKQGPPLPMSKTYCPVVTIFR